MHAVAGMHKQEILDAIDAAEVDELHDIDLTLAELGYDAAGVARSRIAARLALLTAPKE